MVCTWIVIYLELSKIVCLRWPACVRDAKLNFLLNYVDNKFPRGLWLWSGAAWHALCARFCQLAWPRIADGSFEKMLNSPNRHSRTYLPSLSPCLPASKSLINALAHTLWRHKQCRAQFAIFRLRHLFVCQLRTAPTTLLVDIKNLSRNFN